MRYDQLPRVMKTGGETRKAEEDKRKPKPT